VQKGRLVFFALLIVILLLLFASSDLYGLMRYSRPEILSGQLWRIFTAHFVHLNFYHGLLNLVAFGIIMASFAHKLDLIYWLGFGVIVCFCTSLGLLVFSPEVIGYVGFSGVLHGLFAIGVVLCFFHDSKFYALVLLVLLVKLTREQLPGFDVNHMAFAIDGAVIVDAHLYGAIVGVFTAVFYVVVRAWGKRPKRSPKV